VCQ
jgi:hypothetical protein